MRDSVSITAARVRQLFSYDQDTGTLTWRERRIGRRQVVGTLRKDGRRAVMIDGRWYKAHRLVWAYMNGSWPTHQLDHINGDPSDNRICNLREATAAQNAQNKAPSKNNKSGFLGVSWSKSMNKWQAVIETNGIGQHLGHWETAWQASIAYKEAKLKLHTFNPTQRASHEQQ